MKQKTINITLFASVAILVLAFTQAVGHWVNMTIPVNSTLVLNGFVHLTHIRNFGGVFGLWQGGGVVFSVISGILLGLIIAYLLLGRARRYEYICLGFIVGGGGGNILDRIRYGSVIDYVDIQHIPFWNYIFNAADVMVHLGVWPLFLLGLMHIKDEGGHHERL